MKTCVMQYKKMQNGGFISFKCMLLTARNTFSQIWSTWWRHQTETFTALLVLCAGNLPVTGEFPAQRPVTRSFDVVFYLRLNKLLSKQSSGGWFETPSRPLWRHCNEDDTSTYAIFRKSTFLCKHFYFNIIFMYHLFLLVTNTEMISNVFYFEIKHFHFDRISTSKHYA